MTLAAFQRARRKVVNRIVPYKCILGDATGQVYAAESGYYWVRRFDRADANGIVTPGVPFRVRSGTALVVPRGGRQVWVGTGLDGHLTVLGFVHEDLTAPGVDIDPRAAQPNDPYRAWIRLKQIQNFRALPLSTGSTDSMKVQVRQLFYYTEEGDVVRYNGTNASTHIDLTAYVPAAALQRYVVLWLRTYNPNALSDIQVTYSSTISSVDDVLSFDELQECADAADADTIPIQAFRLANAQTTLTLDDTIDVDLRQFMNMPQVYGFPNDVPRSYRVHENHSVIMPEIVSISAGGGVQIQSGGVLAILSTEEEESGSGGGGGMSSFTVAGDSGTPQTIENGNTLTIAGGSGIDTVASATDTITAAVDSTVIRTTGTQSIGAGLTITSPKINEILDPNSNELVKFTTTASAVNELTVANAATGNNPTIEATGGDATVGINITTKNNGTVRVTGKVNVGATLAQGKVTIGGVADEIQLHVQGHSTQLNPLVQFQDSAGVDLIQFMNSGGALFNLAQTSTGDVGISGDTLANLLYTDASADAVGVGTNSPVTDVIFDVVSTAKASRPAPSMTTTQRDAIGSPTAGMLVYNTTLFRFEYYNGAVWMPLYGAYAILVDSKTSNTAGGTSSSTTWNTRDLNTELYDPDGLATISSNKFTPITGDYILHAYTPFVGGTAAGSAGRCRLFNVTDGAAVQQGSNAFGGINAGTVAHLHCKFTASGSDEYRIDTYTQTGRATNGLGVQSNDGSSEIYTVVILQKIA